MIVECVALLMFVQGEITEARYQDKGMAQCIRGKITAERQYSETVSYKCYKGKAKIELYQGRKYIQALILE